MTLNNAVNELDPMPLIVTRSNELQEATRFTWYQSIAQQQYGGSWADRLYVAGSNDGINWQMLHNGRMVFQEPGETFAYVNWPTLFFYSGSWYVLYTLLMTADNLTFGLARSNDLATWTKVCDIPSGLSGVTYDLIWAPSIYVEAGVFYVVYNVEKHPATGIHEIYISYFTDPTLTALSTPVKLIENVIQYGPRYPVLIKIGSTYYLFHQWAPGGTGNISYRTRADLAGLFDVGTAVDITTYGGGFSWEYTLENIVPLGTNAWRLYFNQGDGYWFMDTLDNFVSYVGTAKRVNGLPAPGKIWVP